MDATLCRMLVWVEQNFEFPATHPMGKVKGNTYQARFRSHPKVLLLMINEAWQGCPGPRQAGGLVGVSAINDLQ